MNKKVFVILVAVVIIAGILGYLFFTRQSGTPSTPNNEVVGEDIPQPPELPE